ncbi:MAG: YHS domain-containing protein [Proteobacteria bacterium]|nr:YHS domain-containing protein [Pseudomonadota bacterium]
MKSPENLKNNLIDPVCGMAVDPKHANAFATLEGSTYYFCAEGCRKAFEANPESI